MKVLFSHTKKQVINDWMFRRVHTNRLAHVEEKEHKSLQEGLYTPQKKKQAKDMLLTTKSALVAWLNVKVW
ncbi:MAG: hypothetical protein CL920_19640 [Deltaproteobacteria bacterium]|nr:hypothetical protein [Deltaproteobacteria bacterium]